MTASYLKNQMRHPFYFCILVLTISGCNTDASKQAATTDQSMAQIKACPPGDETINLLTTFKKHTANTPTDRFYSICNFISNKGFFKQRMNTRRKIAIKTENTKTFYIVYDTCVNKRINKNFILENVHVSTLRFIGKRKDRFSGLVPEFSFAEWKFTSNTDRDSAMKIVETARACPNNLVMYEKIYAQFIKDKMCIYVLEASAKFVEPYVIKYKKLIEQFIKTNYPNSQQATHAINPFSMDIIELHKQYWFHEGAIKSFYLDVQNNSASIEFLVKRIINHRPKGPLQEEDLVPCTLRLTFEDLIEVSLFDKFPTQGYYLNFCTYKDDPLSKVGLMINVHDSSSYVHEKDNWVIRAKRVKWMEV